MILTPKSCLQCGTSISYQDANEFLSIMKNNSDQIWMTNFLHDLPNNTKYVEEKRLLNDASVKALHDGDIITFTKLLTAVLVPVLCTKCTRHLIPIEVEAKLCKPL